MLVFTPSLLPVLKPDDERMPTIAHRITSSSLLPPMHTCTSAGQSRDLMPICTPSFFACIKTGIKGHCSQIVSPYRSGCPQGRRQGLMSQNFAACVLESDFSK